MLSIYTFKQKATLIALLSFQCFEHVLQMLEICGSEMAVIYAELEDNSFNTAVILQFHY